jgi:hypothetical protein
MQLEIIALGDMRAADFKREPRGQNSYMANREELQIIDAAMAAIDRGEIATDAEIEAAFAKSRRE